VFGVRTGSCTIIPSLPLLLFTFQLLICAISEIPPENTTTGHSTLTLSSKGEVENGRRVLLTVNALSVRMNIKKEEVRKEGTERRIKKLMEV